MNEGAMVPGGYLLHSPTARKTAARVATAHSFIIAAVIALVAADTHQFDAITIAFLISACVWSPVISLLPFDRWSFHVLAKVYFLGAGSFFFFAFHFDNPYLLLGIFPETIAFADIYWYRRSLVALHEAILFGGFTLAALLIGGGVAAAMILVAMPMMIAGALLVGSTSHRFIHGILQRQQFQTTVTSLLEALHARDGYTGDHSRETLALAMAVADEMGLGEDERKELADVSLLHDIGKIGIPNSILQKPGALTDEEWEVMRQHPVIGEQILADVPGFAAVAKAVRHEHERWDGAGYPDGIPGEQIPLASRIVFACDAYHAMTSDRPYRKAMPVAAASEELRRHAGSQFDPRVAAALCSAIEHGVQDKVGDEQAKSPFSIEPDLSDTPHDAAFELPSPTAPVRLSQLPVASRRLTGLSIAASWVLVAATTSAFLLAEDSFDRFGAAFVACALAIGLVCAATSGARYAKAVGFCAGLLAYVFAPLAALQYDQPAMLMLMLGAAVSMSAHFWHNLVTRAVQIVLVLTAFVALPVVIFGAAAVPFAAVSTRAFPGVLLLIGYFVERLTEMRFERRRFGGTMSSLLLALHARDGYTGKHSDETVEMAMRVADQLGLDERERLELKDVALLHDIGKIGIPDEILNKPGKLTADEWETMRQHPVIGEQIVGRVPGFESVAKAIRHEHERWDGNGYPDGLCGAEIPFASRIVLVCDAFHAMTSNRPYRDSLGEAAARRELLACSGTQFDPQIVAALLAVLNAAELDTADCEEADDSQRIRSVA